MLPDKIINLEVKIAYGVLTSCQEGDKRTEE